MLFLINEGFGGVLSGGGWRHRSFIQIQNNPMIYVATAQRHVTAPRKLDPFLNEIIHLLIWPDLLP